MTMVAAAMDEPARLHGAQAEDGAGAMAAAVAPADRETRRPGPLAWALLLSVAAHGAFLATSWDAVMAHAPARRAAPIAVRLAAPPAAQVPHAAGDVVAVADPAAVAAAPSRPRVQRRMKVLVPAAIGTGLIPLEKSIEVPVPPPSAAAIAAAPAASAVDGSVMNLPRVAFAAPGARRLFTPRGGDPAGLAYAVRPPQPAQVPQAASESARRQILSLLDQLSARWPIPPMPQEGACTLVEPAAPLECDSTDLQQALQAQAPVLSRLLEAWRGIEPRATALAIGWRAGRYHVQMVQVNLAAAVAR